MDIEQKQAEHIEFFVKQASTQKGASLLNVVVEATSHPHLFAFSEILAVPNLRELEGTENSVYLGLLGLFAHGTWNDYKSFGLSFAREKFEKLFCSFAGKKFENCFVAFGGLEISTMSFEGRETHVAYSELGNAGHFPHLVPDQILKLKQLTVLTLAEANKVLPYDVLMQELDVTNVRELEDFLINECMYMGIVRGKLDQLRRCLEVQFAAGRDLRPGQLGSMIQTLSTWLSTSDNLLSSIQEKIKWADTMSELDKKHRKEVQERIEEVKKSLSLKADIDFRGHEGIYSGPDGLMDYEEDPSRHKRRRHPIG